MRTIFAIFISCIVIACNQSEKKPTEFLKVEPKVEKTPQTKPEKLKLAFEKKDYPAFFELFPDNFKDFVDLYGFDENTGEKPLYSDAKDHIPFLFNAPKEYFTPLIEKTVNIAIKGKWEADAVSYFQQELYSLISEHQKDILLVLKPKSDKESAGIWYFIFDGSSKYDLQIQEMFRTTYNKIKPLNSKQAEILKKEYNKLYR